MALYLIRQRVIVVVQLAVEVLAAVEEVVLVVGELVVLVVAIELVAVIPNSELALLAIEQVVVVESLGIGVVMGRLGRRGRRDLRSLLGLVYRLRLLVCKNGLQGRLGCRVDRIGGSLWLLGRRDSSVFCVSVGVFLDNAFLQDWNR